MTYFPTPGEPMVPLSVALMHTDEDGYRGDTGMRLSDFAVPWPADANTNEAVVVNRADLAHIIEPGSHRHQCATLARLRAELNKEDS